MTTTVTSPLGTGGFITQVSTSGIVLASFSPPAPPPGGSLTVSIERFMGVQDDLLVAPVAEWFRAVVTGANGVDGNPISTPAGDTNVYDPVAMELSYDWGFGDPGYVPILTVIPAWMNNLNRSSAPRPCHVFHSHGNKTVSLLVTDPTGQTGVAFYTFGPGGDAPAIANPETHFAGRTVFFSQDGVFPGGTPTADQCTTVAQVNTRIGALFSGGQTFVRLSIRRGETFTNLPTLTNSPGRNIYIDAYGEGARPKHIRSGLFGDAGSPFKTGGFEAGFVRIIDQDCEGGWNADLELGTKQLGVIDEGSRNATHRILFHRCRFSGFDAINGYNSPADTKFWIWSDTEVTNWSDYGAQMLSSWQIAALGCYFHQHPDALMGIDHIQGAQQFARAGNRHGPFRLAAARHTHIACSRFFTRNGWSEYASSNWNTSPPTAPQHAFRHSHGNITVRNYHCHERNVYEAGEGSWQSSNISGTIGQSNYIFDANIFLTSADSGVRCIWGYGLGARFTNNVFLVPPVQTRDSNRLERLIHWLWQGTPDPSLGSRVIVRNNTAYVLASNGELGGAVTRVMAQVSTGHELIEADNLYVAPNLSPALGGALGPFDTPTIVGLTPEYKGWRWNFPPVNHFRLGSPTGDGRFLVTVGSVREGGAGDVAPGEWISVAYPNYTGFCNGALPRLVTQADCTAAVPAPWSGPRIHQFILFDLLRPGTEAEGQVNFNFTSTHIRVQNNTAAAWPSTRGFWIILDLREHLMGHITSRANPASVALLRRQTADAARTSFALRDITGAERATTTRIGAVEVLPA
jgi:hypothetical protein